MAKRVKGYLAAPEDPWAEHAHVAQGLSDVKQKLKVKLSAAARLSSAARCTVRRPHRGVHDRQHGPATAHRARAQRRVRSATSCAQWVLFFTLSRMPSASGTGNCTD